MLKTLIIRNYVLIEALELNFHPGFTSITGETGAGKSILLGAIALLMGQRAESSIVGPHGDKCVIEAHFSTTDEFITQLLENEDIDLDESNLIIRRELSLKGKSRAFVNDTPCSLTLLKQLSEYLIDIHSQHKNLLLGDSQFQLSVLDLYGGSQKELKLYQSAYQALQKEIKILEQARLEASEALREQDYIQFQYTQLAEANLQIGEQEKLESEEEFLTHAHDIKNGLSRAYLALDDDERGALRALYTSIDALDEVLTYYEDGRELYERLQSARLEVLDISNTISRFEDSIEYDSERLAFVSHRLDLINSLLNKHSRQTVEELIELRDELDDKLNNLNNHDMYIAELENKVKKSKAEVRSLAEALYKKRFAASQQIEKILVSGLKELGMPYVRFSINLEHSDEHYNSSGGDKVTYLFSANKKIEPEPVAHIASGGEISRLMLCIKALIAGHRSLPTIIFDEIDTGVSGDIADRIGSILQNMGENMQVMAVTHLPQIAASGDTHIYIYKEHRESETISHIRYLDKKERIEEIARMQSGNKFSDITLAAAEELLTNAQHKKNETK